ncbi:uncharacterized protein METZ01_LOCUS433496, partial [marine metagenome]
VRDVTYNENGEATYSESTHVYEEWGKFDSWVDNVDGAERKCAVGREEEISTRDSTLTFDSCYCWDQNDRFYNPFGD